MTFPVQLCGRQEYVAGDSRDVTFAKSGQLHWGDSQLLPLSARTCTHMITLNREVGS
jgi:hypothetical protein